LKVFGDRRVSLILFDERYGRNEIVGYFFYHDSFDEQLEVLFFCLAMSSWEKRDTYAFQVG
jgi:hypothetical protein